MGVHISTRARNEFDGEKMKYVELKKHIDDALKGVTKFEPIYLIGGGDAYLRQSATAMFKGLVDPDYADFNLSIVAQGQGVSSAIDALSLYPVFDERKVVIIPDFPEKVADQDKDLIKGYLKAPNPASIFVVVGDEKSVKDFAKEEKLAYVDCDKLDENMIAFELDTLLKEDPQKSIEPKALHALVEKTLGDMSRIVCEVKKLKSYSGDIITLQDVEVMVAPDLEFAIYELTGAVSEKQPEKALEILDVFFKQGVRGHTIITMLYGQYRKMLHAELHKATDNGQLASHLGISTGQLYHVKRVSKNYTQVRLKQAVDYLHNLQYSILIGKRLEQTAVHDAVLTLLNI